MNEREIANAGHEFKARVQEAFGFLVTEFGFEPAIDRSSVYAHRLLFKNDARDQVVEVLDAFHGIDYGFEVNVHLASGPRQIDDRRMVYAKEKEDQEPGFPFLGEAAQKLRSMLQEHGT
jgi:hypothetical protein